MHTTRMIATEKTSAAPAKRPAARAASTTDIFQSSPVLDLQRTIEFAYYEPVVEPWPGPARALIIVGGSIGLWGIIAAAVFAALKH